MTDSKPYHSESITVYFNNRPIAYCTSVEDARRVAIAMNHVVAEDNCISWGTSCENCAKLLDKLYEKDRELEASRDEEEIADRLYGTHDYPDHNW